MRCKCSSLVAAIGLPLAQKQAQMALVENIQRSELTALEEAQAYVRLQESLHLTQEQVAHKVGKDRATVANTMRLLRLPREVKEPLGGGKIDAGHARALLALERPGDQVGLAWEAARKALSVREVERRVAALRAPRAARRGEPGEPRNRRTATV